jgi:hypothetical protein
VGTIAKMHLSETGQVRATVEDLLQITFFHKFSGLDTEVSDPTKDCGRLIAISGFTEWVGQSVFPISIGWDWHIGVVGDTVRLIRVDCPRTNIQITSSDGQDFAWEENLQILGTIVDALPWVNSVAARFMSSGSESAPVI